jgi:hypothetical protein
MLNPNYVTNLERRINAVTTCQELAQINGELLEYLISLQSSVAGQISTYAKLVIAPTDLGSLITWATTVIATFAGPYAQAIAMEAQLVTLEASLMALIASKMGTLSCQRILQSNLNTMMRTPSFGMAVNGLSVFGGG